MRSGEMASLHVGFPGWCKDVGVLCFVCLENGESGV